MMGTNTENEVGQTLTQLGRILEDRKGAKRQDSYVAELYALGNEQILRKVGEESTELILAGAAGERQQMIHETADLWFHTLVLLAHNELGPTDIINELRHRFARSGLEEKAARAKTQKG